MRISASEQVRIWLTSLPPQTKHTVRLALRGLAEGRGDIRALKHPLEGFCRIRVGAYRIVYRQVSRNDILLEYASSRDRVYEVFQQMLRVREEAKGCRRA